MLFRSHKGSPCPSVVCEEMVKNIFPSEYSGKIRLVPFNSVSGEGLLPAFKPDKLTVLYGKDRIATDKVYIAVTKSKFGTYSALLNPDLLQKTTA